MKKTFNPGLLRSQSATTVPPMDNTSTAASFKDLGLSEPLLKALEEMGYKYPTLVQERSFSPVLSGSDVVVQSFTGSGKTTAFCLPILQKIRPEQTSLQALILAPTRELAKQVAVECSRLGFHLNIQVIPIYGGASLNTQIDALQKGCHIAVGTPGRVRDLITRGHLKTSDITKVVLDEADEMLSMGFWDDVTWIIDQTPTTRQTLLFSATVPEPILHTINKLLKEPISIDLSAENPQRAPIRHIFHAEDERLPKQRNLLSLLEFHAPSSAFIFCNTKEDTDLLARYLRKFGLNTKALHGDISQSEREKTVAQFKEGLINFLVATDIAARGLDISGLSHIFNYELPHNNEVYIHRSGRTGRMGKPGTAVSLIRGQDIPTIESLREQYDLHLEELPLVSEEEVIYLQAERIVNQLSEESDGVEIGQYKALGVALQKRGELPDLLAFLLRKYFLEPHRPTPNKTFAAETGSLAPPPPKPAKTTKIVKAPAPSFQENGPTRIYVTLGSDDGFNDIIHLCNYLSDVAQIDLGHFLGTGNLREHSSHLEVESEIAQSLIVAINGKPRPPRTPEQKPADSESILCEPAESERGNHKFRRRY